MSEPRSAAEQILATFPETSATMRALRVLPAVVPSAPPLHSYTTLDEAAAAGLGGIPADLVASARTFLRRRGVDRALRAARMMDAGDRGLAVVSGLRSAVALFSGGDRSGALAAQQLADAAAKAFGLAYVATQLLPVPSADRLPLLLAVPAGQELVSWYGAVEVALPFGPAVSAANGRFVRDLLRTSMREFADEALAVVGQQGVADARGLLADATDALDAAANAAAPHTGLLAERLRAFLPARAPGDLHEIAAVGVDALPTWQLLVARLAVEASIAAAKHHAGPFLELPEDAEPLPPAVAAPAAPPLPDALKNTRS
jgi:hypothetical protein